MSTRSVICRQTDDGVQAIYCHFDGYLTGVGAMLALFYKSRESLDALFALGDLSSLGNSPEESIAYCRDMGDEGTEPVVYVTLKGVCNVARKRYGAQYIYYHNGRYWEVAPVSYDGYGVFTGKFSPLAGPAAEEEVAS